MSYKGISTPMSRARPRVLVAEDYDAMREKVVSTLSKHCEVVGAVADGNALVEAAGPLEPDLLVIDVSMPGLSGIEAAKRLRELGSTARIVFLTIHEDPECVHACLVLAALDT